jgi:hypothetical protein
VEIVVESLCGIMGEVAAKGAACGEALVAT